MTPDELTQTALDQIKRLDERRALAIRRAQITPDYRWADDSGWKITTDLFSTTVALGWLSDPAVLRHRLRETREYLATSLGYWEDEITSVQPYTEYALVRWSGLSRTEDDLNGDYEIEAWLSLDILPESGVLKPGCRVAPDPSSKKIVCDVGGSVEAGNA